MALGGAILRGFLDASLLLGREFRFALLLELELEDVDNRIAILDRFVLRYSPVAIAAPNRAADP